MVKTPRPPIEEIARRYREAQSRPGVKDLAESLGMTRQNLHRIVTDFEKAQQNGPGSDTATGQ